MTFEFVPQSPSGAIPFKRFIQNNKAEMISNEPAKIVFVESDLYFDNHIRFVGLTILFENVEFKNNLMYFDLIGKSRIAEFKLMGESRAEIKFKETQSESYNFMRSLLIADGLMTKNNHQAIINNVYDLKSYLEEKEIIIDGQALKRGNLIVKGVV
jgi:hypothetical protein